MLVEVDCPFCELEFEAFEGQDGECPKCLKQFTWDSIGNDWTLTLWEGQKLNIGDAPYSGHKHIKKESMEALLKFNLPEEQGEFEDACAGTKLRGAAQDYDNWLRGKLKYEELSDEAHDIFQAARDKLHEVFEDEIWK